MTPAQEQAASAARKACIAWMRTKPRPDENSAFFSAVTKYRRTLEPGVWDTQSEAIHSAYLAAWRTTWETA